MNPFATLVQPLHFRAGIHEPCDLVHRQRSHRKGTRGGTLPVIPNPWSLTPTECYIVARLSEGERLTDIGRSLGISVKTAWVHRDRATGKMGAASIAETIERWLAEQRVTYVRAEGGA